MAKDVSSAPAVPATTGSPGPGRIDRLLAIVDRLPGPAAFWYAAVAMALLALAHLVVWATGARPATAIEPEVIPPALILAYFLWLLHLLNRMARSAFDDFRPALGASADRQERYLLELTSIPDRVAIAAIVILEVVLNVAYFGTVRPLRPPLPLAVEIASGILYVLVAAAIGLLIVHTVRQLRLVSRLSALAPNVDIFKPAPVNAFSRLTAASAIGILAFVGAFALTTPVAVSTTTAAVPIASIAELAIMTALALASFVLPLRGMHGRLAGEKLRLLDEAQDRLKVTLSRIHAAVDSNDLSTAQQLHESLATVLAERDVLAKLPTWPWSSGTFRGVASAVLLPVVIFVITRLIDQLL